jgi:hypothetical protein
VADAFDETRPLIQAMRQIFKDDVSAYPRIRFQNGLFSEHELILVHGAITTPELYAAWKCSLAHLHEDGTVSRFGRQ